MQVVKHLKCWHLFCGLKVQFLFLFESWTIKCKFTDYTNITISLNFNYFTHFKHAELRYIATLTVLRIAPNYIFGKHTKLSYIWFFHFIVHTDPLHLIGQNLLLRATFFFYCFLRMFLALMSACVIRDSLDSAYQKGEEERNKVQNNHDNKHKINDDIQDMQVCKNISQKSRLNWDWNYQL